MPDPGWWNLERKDGRLRMDGQDLADLSVAFGTPVHVASAPALRARCERFRAAFADYPGGTRIHYSYKTNNVAGLLRVIHGQGIGAEVVDGYELWLARKLGVPADDVVFNGPNKSDDELRMAIEQDIGLLVVDGLSELDRIEKLARTLDRRARIALRICPDIVPRGMNASSLTGSRKNQFGLDDRAGEVTEAIVRAVPSEHLQLRGIHAHIGSGIHDLRAFEKAAERVMEVQLHATEAGADPDVIDLGGGLGTRLSREFTTTEMLVYLGMGRLPKQRPPGQTDLLERYGQAVSGAVQQACERWQLRLPTLVLEPGRALVSDAQVLLLTVGAVRERPGVGRFALTDGGAMTVSMMFLSELHAVFVANREAETDGRTNVFGRLPSPMDVVYRNLPLPHLQPHDVLAVMDAGAYFTATSTNFGGPRPGVVLLDDGVARLVRRPETFEDLARVELDIEED